MAKSKPDHSAIGRRSKRKGKTYERRCAKILTEFTGINFRPTPASGGFNKQGVTIREELFCGDLICDSPNFRFCIEAKNREEFSFTALLKKPQTAAFTKWWWQCTDDAQRVGLFPLLFFKPDNNADFVVMTKDQFLDICPQVPAFILDIYDGPMTIKVTKDRVKQEVTVTLPTPVVMDWKQFVSHCDPGVMFNAMLRSRENEKKRG